MNSFKMISATALFATVMALMATPVNAQVSQDQSLDVSSDVRVECTSGSYGQNLNCTVDAEASASGDQSQRVDVLGRTVVYRADGTPVLVHQVADTALDTNTMIAAFGTISAGLAGAVTKFKNRA